MDETNNIDQNTGSVDVGNTPKSEGKKDVVSSIVNKLSSMGETAGSERDGELPQAKEATPFDITKLTTEQLQSLKAQLNVTPDQVTRQKTIKPKVALRRMNDKFVVDMKRAYLKVIRDNEQNRDVERHVIPVKFKGEENFTEVLYSDFINSERIFLEVAGVIQDKERIEEGTTISRTTGLPVVMERIELKNTFIIKLPNGEELKIEGRMANA